MTAKAATAQFIPSGINEANHFVVKVTCPALTSSDTLDVTLPTGCPADALPVGPPVCYSLSSDTYTKDTDIGDVTTHNRATGVTRITPTGNVAAGSVLLLHYMGHG